MGRFPHGRQEEARPRERLRGYLERGYRGRPGALAKDIEVSGKVAENLLSGHWPSDLTWRAIVTRFGRDVLEAVFAPDIEPVIARLTQEERELRERLNEVAERRRQASGLEEGGRPFLRPAQGRSFRR